MSTRHPRPHCGFCLKEFDKASQVQRHIQKARSCRRSWDREVARRPHLSRASSHAFGLPSTEQQDGHSPHLSQHEGLIDTFVPEARAVSPELSEPPSKRARVEDIEDEGEPNRYVKAYLGRAADEIGEEDTEFERLRASQTSENPFAPFCDRDEWQLAEWLTKETTQKPRDAFLKLPIVSRVFLKKLKGYSLGIQTKNRTNPSYTSAHTLQKKVDNLPIGPGWLCDMVRVDGDRTGPDGKTMTEELELWRRDPVACVRDLMGNAAFNGSMAYVPETVYEDERGESRVYDETWTGDWWSKAQVSDNHDQNIRIGTF